MDTRAHKVTWYGKSGDQLKENEVVYETNASKVRRFSLSCMSFGSDTIFNEKLQFNP